MPRRTEIRCAGRHLGFIAVFNKVLFWQLELCFLSFIDKFEKTIVCSTTQSGAELKTEPSSRTHSAPGSDALTVFAYSVTDEVK